MKWIPGAGRAEDEQLEADYEKMCIRDRERFRYGAVGMTEGRRRKKEIFHSYQKAPAFA